jgi:hypothetical protein
MTRTQVVRAIWIAEGAIAAFLGSLLVTWLLEVSLRRALHWSLPGWVGTAERGLSLAVAVSVGAFVYRRRDRLRPKSLGPPLSSPIEGRIYARVHDYVGWRLRVGTTIVWLLSMYVGARIVWGDGDFDAEAGWAVFFVSSNLAFAANLLLRRLLYSEYKDLLRGENPRRELPSGLPERATELQALLVRASYLDEELREAVRVQEGVLDEIRQRVDDQLQVAAISREEAESVARVMDARQEPARRRSFWISLFVNAFFYVLGVVTPIALRFWFHLG